MEYYLGFSFKKEMFLGPINRDRSRGRSLSFLGTDWAIDESIREVLFPIFQAITKKKLIKPYHYIMMRLYQSIIFITLLLTAIVSSKACHHSCNTCLDQYYTHCYTCQDRANTFTNLKFPNNTSLGMCTTPAYSSANPLGVLILLFAIVSAIFLKSQHIFYFIFSFQIFGLLSLIEVAYSYPLTVILDSFQYFMIFSIMQRSSKTDDGILIGRNMYRLDTLIKQVDLKSNILTIFIITLIAAIFLAMVLAFRKFRNNACPIIKDKTLDNILAALRTIVLLTMQEMLLDIYLSIRLGIIGSIEIAIIVIYLIVVVFLLVDINWHKLPYFKSRKLLNLVIAQRLILPVLVIVPFNYTYNLIIFLNGFAVIELLFLIKSSAKTKHYVYSIIHLLSCVLVAIFIGLDLGQNNAYPAYISSAFATLGLSIFIACLFIEILLSLKNQFFGGKISHLEETNKLQISEKVAILKQQETIADQYEPNTIFDTHKKSKDSLQQTKVKNLLQPTKRKERKFKVQRE